MQINVNTTDKQGERRWFELKQTHNEELAKPLVLLFQFQRVVIDY
jgi:hypothetical protein